MLLTKKTLRKILQDWRVSIPAELRKELLHEYGNFATDDEGHVFEYTEQDICEQLRKNSDSTKIINKEVRSSVNLKFPLVRLGGNIWQFWGITLAKNSLERG